MRTILWPLMALALGAHAACAAPEPPTELRLLVKLRTPTDDPAIVAQRLGASAGVAVRYVAASSPQWHAVMLRCAAPAECEAALARLRADTVNVEAVQTDERKRIVTP